jgi:ribonuclease P protein component
VGTAGPIPVLTRRADFVAASHALRAGTPGFSLQARARGDDDSPRVGFTCSRKVGNAVARNRAKRRLRALAREVLAEAGRPGWDYVLVGRPGSTAELPFDRLRDDLRAALARIHRPPPADKAASGEAPAPEAAPEAAP